MTSQHVHVPTRPPQDSLGFCYHPFSTRVLARASFFSSHSYPCPSSLWPTEQSFQDSLVVSLSIQHYLKASLYPPDELSSPHHGLWGLTCLGPVLLWLIFNTQSSGLPCCSVFRPDSEQLQGGHVVPYGWIAPPQMLPCFLYVTQIPVISPQKLWLLYLNPFPYHLLICFSLKFPTLGWIASSLAPPPLTAVQAPRE